MGLSLSHAILRDRLLLLFRQSVLAIVGSLFAAYLYAWVVWGNAPHGPIITWLVLLSSSAAGRLSLFVAFFRTVGKSDAYSGSEASLRWWEQAYWLTLVISASLWGVGVAWVMPKDHLVHEVVALLIAIGMAGGAVFSYSAYRSMVVTTFALVLLPVVVVLLFQEEVMLRVLAVATLVLGGAGLRATREFCNGLMVALQRSHQMELERNRIFESANIDSLTGISNRTAFYQRADALLAYCMRNQRPLCLAFIDIDHFKRINDNYGHEAGDTALREFGAQLRRSFRKSDVIARLGGEEFAVMLPDISNDAALELCEQLRQVTGSMKILLPDGQSLGFTVSIGLVQDCVQYGDLHSVIRRADKAMYQSKSNGRDQVTVAESATQFGDISTPVSSRTT